MPPAVLRSVYFSLVHPHFIYGIEIYANTYSKYVDPLIKINNKILRILQNKDLKTPINQLYNNYHTLPIPKLHELHILLFMHKYNYDKNTLPILFHNYFKLNSNVHDHNTRQKEMLHSIKFDNSYGKRVIKYKGCMLWSKLPSVLRLYSSKNYFKKKVKIFLTYNLWFKIISFSVRGCSVAGLRTKPVATLDALWGLPLVILLLLLYWTVCRYKIYIYMSG